MKLADNPTVKCFTGLTGDEDKSVRETGDLFLGIEIYGEKKDEIYIIPLVGKTDAVDSPGLSLGRVDTFLQNVNYASFVMICAESMDDAKDRYHDAQDQWRESIGDM